MRLFGYYALHSFVNQLRKMLKTWVLIFLVVCMALGAGIGLLVAVVTDDAGEDAPVAEVDEAYEESEDDSADAQIEESFFERVGVTEAGFVELIAGGVALAMFTVLALGADKNGSGIFFPADVNLLFASPMKPQSVLMFRLTTKLGMAVVCGAYLLFQLPNLTLNLGMSAWAALTLIAALMLCMMQFTLIQVELYLLCSSHPPVKRWLRTGVYALLGLVAAGYLLALRGCGGDYLGAAVRYFNGGASRFIPLWGWLKGLCGCAMEGNLPGAALCLAANLLGIGTLLFAVYHTEADFYEDAMAKSEETAELLARAQSEKSTGIVARRKKDRGDGVRRDGMRHGRGANVFFFKSLYNRFRFAHLGVFTKTMETYLAAAVLVGAVCRFSGAGRGSALGVAMTLAGLAFFRAMGNPLEQDTQMDYFVLIPESAWAKLFWSLMGGTANCLLDALPALLLGAALAGANPLGALAWLPFIASVDFYATCVGTFITLSVPVSAGKTIKQVVQILFVYFGLLPDAALIALGLRFGWLGAAIAASVGINLGLGLLFFALSPLFLEPGSRRARVEGNPDVDLKLARRRFSRLGLGAFTILAVATALQIAASVAVTLVWPDGGTPSWVIWGITFAPMYLIAVPCGLLVMRKVPAKRPEGRRLGFERWIAIAIISVFMMYAGNLVGVLVTSLLQAALRLVSTNPIETYAMEEGLWMKLLFMVVLAPCIEEYVFRRQLIDRMNVYGEKLAVFASALMFGLFHGNLSQLFYAFALGLVFGYVYLKTGRLRYSIALHMCINFLGSVVGPAVLNLLDGVAPEAGAMSPQVMLVGLYGFCMIALALAGLVLLCVKARSVRFSPAEMELPRGKRLATAFLNPGMLLLFALCLASIALMFFV